MAQGTVVNWGIIGPGGIAQAFAAGVADADNAKLVAIASRNPGKPELKENFPGVTIHDGYEAILADDNVDAIYIATPHPGHAEWAIKAAEAGKHVLCEKPIALNAAQADAIFFAAQKAGTFAAEAFMYRVHPQTAKLIEVLKSKVIGDVRKISSSFGFQIGFDPEHRLLANDLAGGGILDVGCYPASMSRLIAGLEAGEDFLDPISVSGAAHLGETGVDEWASAILKFSNNIVAEISCSVSLNQDNVLRIFGSKGYIEVPDFWFCGFRSGGVGTISVFPKDGEAVVHEVPEKTHLYAFEAIEASKAILAGESQLASPGMSWADTVGNMKVLDQWRASVGLTFDIETPERATTTLKGEKLAKKTDQVRRVQIEGLSQPTSVVALGFESFNDFSKASIIMDSFYERGGNLFDTAFIYAGGRTEEIMGEWYTSRGLKREDFVVIGKGAHSPLVYPDIISKQLDITLDRMKTDYVDLYFMHRDNEDIPVGEFVDAMDDEVQKGRIRGLHGGSNWTHERMDEAIAYAKANGKAVPGALSNNFSLAQMANELWAGVRSASGAEFKNWLNERQMPNYSWSSQARGFFTDRAGPDKLEDDLLVRGFYSDSNFARRDRAVKLAAELGCSANNVAMAYLLSLSHPVIPLIGPQRLVELEDSLAAVNIQLTPEQVKWLESGE